MTFGESKTDLKQISAIFDAVISDLREETHDDLDAAAQAWVTKESNKLMGDLKKNLLKVCLSFWEIGRASCRERVS